MSPLVTSVKMSACSRPKRRATTCFEIVMGFENLTDIHTRDDTKRIQDDINWLSICCMWHILWWDNTSDDTLVTMSKSVFEKLSESPDKKKNKK